MRLYWRSSAAVSPAMWTTWPEKGSPISRDRVRNLKMPPHGVLRAKSYQKAQRTTVPR